MPYPTQMSAADTGLLVVDVQEKLFSLIPNKEELIRNIAFLIDGAKHLGMTVQATEQYPKGLGPTVAELAKRIPERPDKNAFTCCAIPSVVENFRKAGCVKVLVTGIETHVCVHHTAQDLQALGFRAYVAADAVGSRYAADHDIALRRLEQAGVVVTTSESAVFEWVGGAGSPLFKGISQLVQERMKAMGERVAL